MSTSKRIRGLGALLVAAALGACDTGTDPSELAGDLLTEAELDAAAVEAEALEVTTPAPDSGRVRAQEDSWGHQARPDRPGCCWIDRAGLFVDLGSTAVKLAGRYFESHGAGEEQAAILARAREFDEAASAALAEGRLHLAVELARVAGWTALKAIVVPGGVTKAEAREIRASAAELLERAREVVGDDATELERALLVRAGRLFERGTALLEEGKVRGVAWLWRAAVLSAYLVGD